MDYNVTASVFNVTISAGAISSSFNIDINDDVTHEDNETFNVTIKLVPTARELSLCISSSTVTIIDHDGTYNIIIIMLSDLIKVNIMQNQIFSMQLHLHNET